jgi:hypothetical protein
MLSLIVPTKGRPDGVARLLKSIDVPCGVMLYAVQESDIPTNVSVINELLSIEICYGNGSVVSRCNEAAKKAHNDLAVICDDMEFLPGALSKALEDIEPGRVTGFLTANIPDAVPVLFYARDYYKDKDTLLNPAYQHFFVDQEAMEVAIDAGKFTLVTDYPLLNHYHPGFGGVADGTHSSGRSAKWNHDNEIYSRRLLHR